MDLDFLLFTPPKCKYSFLDLWGEVVFIPKTRKKALPQPESLASFLNCYKATTHQDIHLSTEGALLEAKGFQLYDIESSTQESSEEEEVEKYVPCLYLGSMVNSHYLLLYFHASGEDVKLAHNLLNNLRNYLQALTLITLRSTCSPSSTPATASTRESPTRKSSRTTPSSSTTTWSRRSASSSKTSSSWGGPSGREWPCTS